MNAIFEPLIGAGVFPLGLVLFLVLSLACEVGYRVGIWRDARHGRQGKERPDVAILTGGMLTLLAFMLGLSIDFAQQRFEARRDLVAVEANAIGTAWLRANLVGGPEGTRIADLIHDYARTRLAFTQAEMRGPVAGLVARTEAQQAAIWQVAGLVARRVPTPITAALISALNTMFDAALSQRFAFDARVPDSMLAVLLLGGVIAIGAVGYQMGLAGARQPIVSSLLLLLWTCGMVITVDLNRPRLGHIRVDASPLVWTLESFAQKPLAIPSPTP